ncbi:MAG: hypothetical protein EXS13_14350 [Planctomycetes bacterium]|nr:hypothetical protein [Planctomycetota bacterium]
MNGRALAWSFAAIAAVPVPGSGWGSEVDGATAAKQLAALRPELLAIVQAKPEARAPLATALAQRDGLPAIEVLKRLRNREFVELERALLLAEKLHDAGALPLAWERLTHDVARLRERAAITCLLLWDRKSAATVAGGKPKEALAALLKQERDLHVRSAFAALERRITGKLEPRQMVVEHAVEQSDGLLLVPFLDGMDKLAVVAPGVRLQNTSTPGGGSAEKLPVAKSWVAPLLDWGKEEVAGLGLQPFANPRQDGTVLHTGQDTGGPSASAIRERRCLPCRRRPSRRRRHDAALEPAGGGLLHCRRRQGLPSQPSRAGRRDWRRHDRLA